MASKQIDRVTAYARKVIKGDIIANKKNIQSCERHIKDMNLKVFAYYFDVERANHVITFLEMLPDPKSGKLIGLAGFQDFIAGSLYGWVDTHGNRRYTKSYISMARKNGKTLTIAGLSLYEYLFGKEPKNERLVGLTANSREQAGIAFDMVSAQLEAMRVASPAVRKITKTTESKKEIINLKDRSKIKAVSNESSNLEGYQFSFAVIDEYHEAVNNKMYETLRRGQVLLNNPSLHIISTAGTNLNSPMFEEYEYATKVLDGVYTNDNYFIFIAEQDSEEEIHNEELWIKSNPLMELEPIRQVLTKNIKADVHEGQEKNDLNGILIKNFNMWRQGSKDTFIAHNDWKACMVEEAPSIKGQEVYIGIDLSRRDDLTAIGFIYPQYDGEYFVDAHVFVGHKGGLQAKSERDKIDYQKLIDAGKATLTDTESGIINDQQLFDWLVEYIENNDLKVQAIMYDPYNAANILVRFEDYTWPLIEVGQWYKNLSEPLKQFRLDVFERKILHDGNPNLTIAINNAITKTDNNSNILLDKKKNREKIDPLVALITGFYQAMHHEHSKKLASFIESDEFGF